MEFIGQVPGSSDTVQSDSIDIPNQDQILAPMIPREPLHANNANELAIFQTCSGKETTCITAGMSTSAESMIHEESPDKPHHIQDGISVPHSSAISVAPGALDLLEHLAALVVMTNQFTDKMPSLGSSSPGADDGTTDSRDRLGRLCIAPNSNDVDLSTLNTLIHLHRQQHFLSNSNISQLAAIISRLLLAQATLLDAVSEFDRVIEHLTLAAQISQGDRSTWINTMQRLSIAYRRRFETHGSAGDIDSAIECQQQAIAYAGDKHESYVILIGELGMLLNLRYEVSGDVGDIQEAIKNGTLALVHTPEASDNRISLLDSLGNSHGYRFFRLGELEDISKVIDYHTQSVQLTPEGHPNLPTRLSNLGISYSSRFEGLGELEDIVKAIDIQTRAVKLAPEEHPAIPGLLSNLGTSYRRRYECLNELEDINKAISCQARAVRLRPEGHPAIPGQLNNLGNSYVSRFERLGQLEDVSKAIECQTRSVQLTSEGHPNMHTQLDSLGISYFCRFRRLGELEDINRAIECQTRAVQLTPEGHPHTPSRSNNLGISYSRRFDRLGKLEDISNAIDCHTQAVLLTPERHPGMPARFSNLGISYMRRFQGSGELEDISKAIEFQTQAIQLTQERHPGVPTQFNSLGVSYFYRFGLLREPEDIKRAIEVNEQALLLLPQTHVQASIIRGALGTFYHICFSYFRKPQDRSKSLEHWEAAACTSIGLPHVRLKASRGWAEALSESDRSASLPAHRIAMQLLPEVIWLGMTSSRRYERITEIGTVAVEAAAAAISSNEYGLSLEWLEEGRSIVWNQKLQLRTPFDVLATFDSVLAQSLQEVVQQLEIANRRISYATPFGAHTMSSEQDTLHHHRLVQQYGQLISQARNLPDFRDFMRPKKAAELMPATRSGPVVVVNVHAKRCDALILLPERGQTAHVPLPDLSEDIITRLHGLMQNALVQSGIRERKFLKPCDQPRSRFEDILIALWYRLVKPILSFLGYTSKLQVDQLPRVTWCTTGALSFLPIHAAGNYGSGQDRIFDYAITSYTPTLSALLATTTQSANKVSGVLAVSQESTPGLSNLPGTNEELAHVKKHLGDSPYKQLENSQATPEAVLDAMEKYECVHLACHASQNAEDPTQSCFHLHNGTLSLEKISQKSLKNKGLAFLSACQTATGDQKMPDEAVHLAAGMLIAGYPSVIATMWSISDCDAPLVADAVYSQLVRNGGLDCSQVARALHVAVSALRAKVGEELFSRWVPYIHMGV